MGKQNSKGGRAATASTSKATRKALDKKAANAVRSRKVAKQKSAKAAKEAAAAAAAEAAANAIDPAFTAPLAELLQPGEGFAVADLDADSTPGWKHSREEAEALTLELGEELSELQERLFAQGRTGGTRSVLLVLQGLDTSGKGGIVRHVLGMVDPQGVSIRSFGVPTAEEREHDYLWRIRNALPAPGRIGVFDRSHYEDVLVVKVDELVPAEVVEARYAEIVAFEEELAAAGTTVIKVALVISADEQYDRLRERLERPDKQWKFSLGDLTTRAKWPLYAAAYDRVFETTSTPGAPWHVVPANRKWYSQLVVTQLLVDALRALDLGWPAPTYDVEAALVALDATKDDVAGVPATD